MPYTNIESISFIPHLGIQLDTRYLLPIWNTSIFIPEYQFKDIFINEGLVGFGVEFYIAISVTTSDDFILIFNVSLIIRVITLTSFTKHLKPDLSLMFEIYHQSINAKL